MAVYSFRFVIRLIRAYCRLFFPTSAWRSAWACHVCSNFDYSVSEKVLFLWERRLLADREVEVNHLNTDCLLTYELQRHLESIAEMSRSQQQDGAI